MAQQPAEALANDDIVRPKALHALGRLVESRWQVPERQVGPLGASPHVVLQCSRRGSWDGLKLVDRG